MKQVVVELDAFEFYQKIIIIGHSREQPQPLDSSCGAR